MKRNFLKWRILGKGFSWQWFIVLAFFRECLIKKLNLTSTSKSQTVDKIEKITTWMHKCR